MEAKYYTPTIEEFHVGFEFERELVDCNWNHSAWQKETIIPETNLKVIGEYISYNRVKYLDREDIESLEWKFGDKIKESKIDLYYKNVIDKSKGVLNYFIVVSKVNWVLIYYTGKLKEDNTLENIVRFSGIIKNKSEFIKVMDQLQIT